MLKKISWGFLTILIGFLILRMMTGASSHDFQGYGTALYLCCILIYLIGAFVLVKKEIIKGHKLLFISAFLLLFLFLLFFMSINYFNLN